jgi:3'-phosphoadenosine 5'-phosphosulfate synthase
MTPEEIFKLAQEKEADAIFAFHVRSSLHKGHLSLLKDIRKLLIKNENCKNPILLLHPLGGWMKDDDEPLDSIIRQHQELLDDGTISPEHTILSIWPSPMFYSGPNEVLWHASSRVNAGISFFLSGRDPAGIEHPEIENK